MRTVKLPGTPVTCAVAYGRSKIAFLKKVCLFHDKSDKMLLRLEAYKKSCTVTKANIHMLAELENRIRFEALISGVSALAGDATNNTDIKGINVFIFYSAYRILYY